jgi:hypothetical protein
MGDNIFNFIIGVGLFIGFMLATIAIVYLIKLFHEISALKSQKKAYDLMAKEEAYNVKLADLELKEKQRR